MLNSVLVRVQFRALANSIEFAFFVPLIGREPLVRTERSEIMNTAEKRRKMSSPVQALSNLEEPLFRT